LTNFEELFKRQLLLEDKNSTTVPSIMATLDVEKEAAVDIDRVCQDLMQSWRKKLTTVFKVSVLIK